MTRFVQEEVANRRDNPTAGKQITVVVGVVSGHAPSVQKRVKEISGDVREELPFDSLLIELPETELDQLCAMSEIESVEIDEGMEILSGN